MLETRRFIEHPMDIPLEVSSMPTVQALVMDTTGFGGLAFHSAEPRHQGAGILLRFPSVDREFVARAFVVWCQVMDASYRVGITFFDAEDAFRCRMLEQICAIETYRIGSQDDDEPVRTDNEVACAWIEQAGGGFPDP